MKCITKTYIILSNVCCYHCSYQSMLGAVVYSLLFVATTAQGWIGRVETLIRARIHFEEQQKKQRQSINSSTSSITREKRSQNCNDASSRHVKEDCKPRTIKAMKHKTMGEPRRHGMTNRVLTNSGKIVVIILEG